MCLTTIYYYVLCSAPGKLFLADIVLLCLQHRVSSRADPVCYRSPALVVTSPFRVAIPVPCFCTFEDDQHRIAWLRLTFLASALAFEQGDLSGEQEPRLLRTLDEDRSVFCALLEQSLSL